jgi:hypothetical protein
MEKLDENIELLCIFFGKDSREVAGKSPLTNKHYVTGPTQ